MDVAGVGMMSDGSTQALGSTRLALAVVLACRKVVLHLRHVHLALATGSTGVSPHGQRPIATLHLQVGAVSEGARKSMRDHATALAGCHLPQPRGMECLEGMACTIDDVIVRLAFVVVLRGACPTTTPHTRLSSCLVAGNELVRSTIQAAEARLLILDAVASAGMFGQTLNVGIVHRSIRVRLAISHNEVGSGQVCGKGHTLTSHEPVVGGALRGRVASAGPVGAPHARLPLDLEASHSNLVAGILAAQAIQPVGDGRASKTLSSQALHVGLRWSWLNGHCLAEGRIAFADWGSVSREYVRASHRRLLVAAVLGTLECCFAGQVAGLGATVSVAVLVPGRCHGGNLYFAEATFFANFVPHRLWRSAVHMNRLSIVGEIAWNLMLDRLTILAGSSVPDSTLRAVLPELIRLAKVAATGARHTTTPNARLALNLEASDLRVWTAIVAGQACFLLLDRVASLRHPLQALGVAEGTVMSLALGNLSRDRRCPCREGQALAPRQEVVGNAFGGAVVRAGPSCAPHARLSLNLQALDVGHGAAVLVTEAVQLVVQSTAALLRRVQACELSLCRARQVECR
mmetsp:Transcript_136811/g.324165  ORF Transcript_136811/g.324165 Transcript_136811/m.324165 type:complete len:574 (-) Transcript_136811:4461-6182(-)